MNEAIERGLATRDSAGFVCECGRVACSATIALSVVDYEAVRTNFERFVTPDHEMPELDHDVERHDEYLVIIRARFRRGQQSPGRRADQ